MNATKETKETYNSVVRDANQAETRFIIKRSGKQVPYEPVKIRKAIEKANAEEARQDRKLSDADIDEIVGIMTSVVFHKDRALSVEEIQDLVEEEMAKRSFPVFLLYHDYRAQHTDMRKKTGLMAKIEGIVEVQANADGSVSVQNEEVKQENSNKNPVTTSVQRDYVAGEVSKEYSARYLIPPDVLRAHEEGIIHFHDSDYFVHHQHNCDLINLEDMLQNGTCLSGVKIDPPKSFETAATVTSQIIASVASSQYGGQSFSLSHLAPFVEVSRKKIRGRLKEAFEAEGLEVPEEKLNKIAEKQLRKEVEAGCQTIQYQLITLQCTNGQAPFVTAFMYLNEVPEGRLRNDLAMLIEVMLEQRILGVKDRSGSYITPAFPKLIYVLQENNIREDSEFFYLTRLAAECTAKRMVPDYVSEKIALALKGDVYTPMGCRSFLTPDRFTEAGAGNVARAGNYVEGKKKYYGRSANVALVGRP